MTLKRWRKPVWTKMREGYEEVHNCLHKFFWKAISYLNERELVRGDSRSHSTTKVPLLYEGMVLPPVRKLKLES